MKVIHLFTEAYGAEILHSLNVRHCCFLQEEKAHVITKLHGVRGQHLLDIIQLSEVTQLDLSYNPICRSLQWLGMLGQCCLTHLVLRGVGLVDKDIIYLTACAAIKSTGLSKLEHLDLSGIVNLDLSGKGNLDLSGNN